MVKTSEVTRSQELYAEACQVMPGGISRNTIFRQPNPDYVDHASGCYVTDMQGTRRIDFANNMCALIHGHAHPQITRAVAEQLPKGTAFTLATEIELRFAQLLCSRSAGFEKIRFMNSGTEAVMSAIKTARAVTGRPMIAKTEGAYHGTYDYAEVSQKPDPSNWGPPDRPNSVPLAAGTPRGALADVVVFPFNDIARTIAILEANATTLAAVLLDLLPHRVGFIPASEEYVNAIRQWTSENNCLLIFDEVITFRQGYGGAQENYGAEPDLTSMGKIIGGGFPVGALAGKHELMDALDPSRNPIPFPQSGTFSANAITMTAGMAAMQLFGRAEVARLNELGNSCREMIDQAIASSGATACVTGSGSLFRIHLKQEPPVDYRTAWQGEDESKRVAQLVRFMYDNGFMMINTCSGALSTAMTDSEISQFAQTLETGLRTL